MPAKLKIGDDAPIFSVADMSGNLIDLIYQKNQYRLVVFMRYAGCPFCNLAIHRLVLETKLLKDNDCEIIAFIQSSKENIDKNIYARHDKKPKFPIIADQEMLIYKKYCVSPSITYATKMIKNIPHWVHAVKKGGYGQQNVDGSLFLAPAMFLLEPYTSKIIRADYSADLYKHESFSSIYDTIANHKLNG